jgi:tetratricopeptide (TPR) repeat protein
MQIKKIKWLFAAVALFLCWRIVAVNTSQYFAINNDIAALQWTHNNSDAILMKAAELAKTDMRAARDLVQKAIWYEPVNGRTYMTLAQLWQQEGKFLLAEKSAAVANILAPRDADVQLPLGYFWIQRGLPLPAIKHWGAALEATPSLSKSLFPLMLAIGDAPELRNDIAQAIKGASKWWESFFLYTLKNATHEDTIKAIYEARGDKTEHAARQAYLDHLVAKGMSTDAYFVWLNGLQSGELSALGNIYDGGFEYTVSDEGFGWRVLKSSAFKVTTEPTYGNKGAKALHVSFQDTVAASLLTYQYLLLDAGSYTFRGKSRADGLSAGKGVLWSLRCLDLTGSLQLAKTGYFTGTDIWQGFSIDFDVPRESCPMQQLRLEADGSVNDDFSSYNGSAWFDELEIAKIVNK